MKTAAYIISFIFLANVDSQKNDPYSHDSRIGPGRGGMVEQPACKTKRFGIDAFTSPIDPKGQINSVSEFTLSSKN